MKIQVITNDTIAKTQSALRKLKKVAAQFAITLLPQHASETPDFYLVLGGDGSVLRAAHSLPNLKIPLININIGSLGYLTCASLDDLEKVFTALQSGQYSLSKRSLLEARCFDPQHLAFTKPFFALNDLVAMRADSGRVVGITLAVDGHDVTTFLCDGLIVATPTGSTAYSLSAGGPIILPETPAIELNVICPHTLTSRPLVLPDTARISLQITKATNPLTFSVDGQVTTSLNLGDHVEIRLARQQARLVMLPEHNDFLALRHKLNWSGTLLH